VTDASPVWPSARIDQDAASRWVASACAREVGSPTILQVKSWGVTARFEDVVFKASFAPLFPQVTVVHALLERALPGAAPRLLASARVCGQIWTLFEHIPGPTAHEVGTPAAVMATARALATAQDAVARHDLSGIPALDVRAVPRLLLQDVADQPGELVEWLHGAQPFLQADAEALAAIPPSVDHPDVNSPTAIVRDEGRVVLIDWEETTVGCPLFSLDRLLEDARERSAEDLATNAYLDALPWGGREDVDRALRLAPLKLAVEARAFARRLGRPNPHTRYTTRLLEQARERSRKRTG
jgi:hypothetical protein